MPTRKKTRKKQTKASSESAKKNSGTKQRKTTVDKTRTRAKNSKSGNRKAAAGKRSSEKIAPTRSRGSRTRIRPPDRISARATQQADSGKQSGDLQGLGTLAEADSESANELLEEGNAFEADVVSGVESAGDKPERGVRTRQVPEDDVPEEYLDSE